MRTNTFTGTFLLLFTQPNATHGVTTATLDHYSSINATDRTHLKLKQLIQFNAIKHHHHHHIIDVINQVDKLAGAFDQTTII